MHLVGFIIKKLVIAVYVSYVYVYISGTCFLSRLEQRFSNFFQVGTTFINHNVLRTTLLLGL